MAGEGKTIKVCLTNRGNDSETPWAEDLGPVKGAKGARRVRLVNVPFMHAKPTWGDVIVVTPAGDGAPTWDRDGVAWEQIGTRIAEDSGRWAMIVDYTPTKAEAADAYRALVEACHTVDVVCEGAWAPSDGRAGRTYFAVPRGRTAQDVMAALATAKLPCTLAQIHPPPAKVKATAAATAKPGAEGAAATAKPKAEAAAATATAKPNAEVAAATATAKPKAEAAAATSTATAKPKAEAAPATAKPKAEAAADGAGKAKGKSAKKAGAKPKPARGSKAKQ
jgi:hypothetical protein